MNDSQGSSWDWPSVENRTGCELGFLKLMQKKYFELHGTTDSKSTFNDYDVNINYTTTLVGHFIDACYYDENKVVNCNTILIV